MKTLRTILRPLFALLLAFSSAQAVACTRSCGSAPGGTSLLCVKICARSKALLTQGGKLDSVGAQACGLEAQRTQITGVLSQISHLQGPDLIFVGIADSAATSQPTNFSVSMSTRGPPSFSPYLLSQHPFANAPPLFV